ncbi:MAG: NfeD family protein [Rickettsiales bacterium]
MFEHIAQFWFLLGVILIIMEVMLGMTIVLLFAALSAFSVGFLLFIEKIGTMNITSQGALFLTFMLIWAALLWRRLKAFKDLKNPKDEYTNFVGQTATVIHDLHKGTAGSVKWSGTTMNAQIEPTSKHDLFKKGEEVTVVAVKNNTFIVNKE